MVWNSLCCVAVVLTLYKVMTHLLYHTPLTEWNTLLVISCGPKKAKPSSGKFGCSTPHSIPSHPTPPASTSSSPQPREAPTMYCSRTLQPQSSLNCTPLASSITLVKKIMTTQRRIPVTWNQSHSPAVRRPHYSQALLLGDNP